MGARTRNTTEKAQTKASLEAIVLATRAGVRIPLLRPTPTPPRTLAKAALDSVLLPRRPARPTDRSIDRSHADPHLSIWAREKKSENGCTCTCTCTVRAQMAQRHLPRFLDDQICACQKSRGKKIFLAPTHQQQHVKSLCVWWRRAFKKL